MTTPDERTRSVVETREFLEVLASGGEITIPGLLQSVARGLLRHYPEDKNIDVSALALPGVWARTEQQ